MKGADSLSAVGGDSRSRCASTIAASLSAPFFAEVFVDFIPSLANYTPEPANGPARRTLK
jgi:hypothetical protein